MGVLSDSEDLRLCLSALNLVLDVGPGNKTNQQLATLAAALASFANHINLPRPDIEEMMTCSLAIRDAAEGDVWKALDQLNVGLRSSVVYSHKETKEQLFLAMVKTALADGTLEPNAWEIIKLVMLAVAEPGEEFVLPGTDLSIVITPDGKEVREIQPSRNPNTPPQTDLIEQAGQLDPENIDTFIRAAFSASFLIAEADGEIHDGEIHAFIDAIKERLDLELDLDEIVELFGDASNLEEEEHLDRIAEAQELPEDVRRHILEIAFEVAAADGEVDLSEVVCLPAISDALDLSDEEDVEEQSELEDQYDDLSGVAPEVAALTSFVGDGLGDLDPGTNPIIAATKENDIRLVRELLASGHSPSDIHHFGMDAVLLAAREGYVEIVDTLLSAGADPNRANPESGTTPLTMAIKKGRSEVVEILLKHGADPNRQSPYIKKGQVIGEGISPLYMAAMAAGHIDDAALVAILNALKAAGAKDNPVDMGGKATSAVDAITGNAGIPPSTLTIVAECSSPALMNLALVKAVAAGSLDHLKALIDGGAECGLLELDGNEIPLIGLFASMPDVDNEILMTIATNSSQESLDIALHMASVEGQADNVKVLISAGANVDMVMSEQDYDDTVAGDFPLNAAAARGHTDTVKELLSAGANPNRFAMPEGQFPLLMAAENGHEEIVDLLLEAKADPNLVNPSNGTHALGGAIMNRYSGIVGKLLRAGADANSTVSGKPALSLAAHNGSTQLVELLVRHGADPNLQDSDGLTALQRAGIGGHKDIEEFLVRHGADPNTQLVPARATEVGRRERTKLQREAERIESKAQKKLAKLDKRAGKGSFWSRLFK